MQDDVIVISECWAEVDGEPDCGRVHVYKFGAPLESQETGEEVTTHEPSEVYEEPSGGIPGYPLWSIALSLLLITIILSHNKRLTTLLSILIRARF